MTSVYDMICLHIIPSTGGLYFTIYYHFADNRSRVYDHDRGYKKDFWLQGLFDNLEIKQDQLKINYDNMSVIYLVKNQVYHARMKHINVRFHFVSEILEEGEMIHMKDNPADMLTKLVSRAKFNHCMNLLHILLVA